MQTMRLPKENFNAKIVGIQNLLIIRNLALSSLHARVAMTKSKLCKFSPKAHASDWHSLALNKDRVIDAVIAQFQIMVDRNDRQGIDDLVSVHAD